MKVLIVSTVFGVIIIFCTHHDTTPIAQDPDAADKDTMSEFLYKYLQRRFGIEQMIVEWGYNLHDACQRYSHDETINLFWSVPQTFSARGKAASVFG